LSMNFAESILMRCGFAAAQGVCEVKFRYFLNS